MLSRFVTLGLLLAAGAQADVYITCKNPDDKTKISDAVKAASNWAKCTSLPTAFQIAQSKLVVRGWC